MLPNFYIVYNVSKLYMMKALEGYTYKVPCNQHICICRCCNCL